MNHLHRCTLRYYRHHGEAFKTPEWSTAIHGPYTDHGPGIRPFWLVGGVCLLVWLVLS